eukprot:15243165-Heterocapsa_arctica.AAC.1
MAQEEPPPKVFKSVWQFEVVDQVSAELVQADIAILVAVGQLERIRPDRGIEGRRSTVSSSN